MDGAHAPNVRAPASSLLDYIRRRAGGAAVPDVICSHPGQASNRIPAKHDETASPGHFEPSYPGWVN
ncbi:Hypothetical protein MexAM1_META2p0123 (plasmid) [Methylorubrum extorquens AM1]|uniref:Uncharacterized protein n=1 Tax=Methylorubrum extorquens (strain ATCC 14718 / DSM 1338 / JCM 2805 / NCIMB 9133 / AM1) TaxID=272630 RepID=C5B3L8_METEA|nr:Hypothetical protein MexAM1_META2p0123 [Methylorubrum extorquens AM1]